MEPVNPETAEVVNDITEFLKERMASKTASGRFAHNIRVAGADGQYETDDDLVSEDVSPGGTGELIVKLDKPGTYKFRCDFHQSTSGTLVVE